MPDLPRRSLVAGAGLLAGAMALGARAQQQIAGVAVAPKITAKPFTFNPDKVKGLSADLLRSHHGHYTEQVKRLNAIHDELTKLDFATTEPAKLAGIKSEELAVHNATVLHELYFDGIGEAPIPPSGLLAQAMARDYGSMDRWKAEFAACGRSLDAGTGWVIMAYSARDKRISTFVETDDSMTPAGALPLLAMDMAEHAYGPDHGKDVAKYVDAFMAAIKWTNAERLYREAMRV
jgi:superoxide dismutase, Fe-Mn family